MISWPVITRELRAAARAPALYRLRLAVGLIGIALLWLTLHRSGSGLNSGRTIFNVVHQATALILLILTPLMTADAISKEKREGTLDLLFLTSLTSLKFVSTKFVSQFVRVLCVWAVMIPLSTVPLLSGGVLASDVQTMFIVELTVILLGLTAGLLASALSKRMLWSLVLAICFSVTFLWLDVQFMRRSFFPNGNLSPAGTLRMFALNLLVVGFATTVILGWIAWMIKRTKQEQSESVAQRWFRHVFLTPRYWRGTFLRSMRRRMDRNPLIWLEYRTAWSRVGRTAMIGALILIESLVILTPHGMEELPRVHALFAVAFLVLMAITSATSFQREKENGAFELLLVAPFTEFSFISGRLRAVWSYYLPAAISLLLLVVFAMGVGVNGDSWYSSYEPSQAEWALQEARVWSAILSAVAIPIVGLYFALRLKHFIPALLATLAVALFGPMLIWEIVRISATFLYLKLPDSSALMLLYEGLNNGRFQFVWGTFAIYTLLICFFGFSVHHRLKTRQFA